LENINACRVLVESSGLKRLFGKPRRRWERNTKCGLAEEILVKKSQFIRLCAVTGGGIL
jgi:hypothetical protein